MKVLLIEDDLAFSESLIFRIKSLTPNIRITECRDKESGLRQLKEIFFDLIVLDLTIPVSANQPAMSSTNGQEIFYAANELAPGTPIRILTASEPDQFVLDLVAAGEPVKPWGSLRIPEFKYFKKTEYTGLIDDIVTYEREAEALTDVEINTQGHEIVLSELESRAVRIFTRTYRGVSCKIKKLGQGLSGSLVLKVDVENDQGAVISISVAKIGTSKVRTEMDSREWANSLPIGSCPHILLEINRTLKNVSALFYAASDFLPFFDFFESKPEIAATVVNSLRGYLDHWAVSRKREQLLVAEVRRRFVSDETLQSLVEDFGIDITHAENCKVNISSSTVHGDFHAGNVLVNLDKPPVIIDFGDTGIGFTCIDPISLELSLIFHPDSTVSGLFKEGCENWPNLESYSGNHPFREFISSCRTWAHDVGGGDKAVLAVAYAHTLKQFKHETVPKQILIAMINSIAKKLISLT